MRRAHNDTGWIVHNGTLIGVSMGYDHCAEHEWGVKPILNALGVPQPSRPQGLKDRIATKAPAHLFFGEYTAKPRDKRRKGYKAAALAMGTGYDAQVIAELGLKEFAAKEAFLYEAEGSFYSPERDDMACAWDQSGFVIQVRGEENIKNLKTLYEALLAHDVAVAVPWSRAFFRSGITLAIASRVPQEEQEQVLAQDKASNELLDAAAATGIEEELRNAGKGWHALCPDWLNAQKKELLFFLNPHEQSKFDFGWFTLSELKQWARNEGVVVKDKRLEEFKKSNPDFGYDLLVGMKAQGLGMRVHEKLTWFDEAKTVVGVRLLMSADSEDKFASGIYSVQYLKERFPVPEKKAA